MSKISDSFHIRSAFLRSANVALDYADPASSRDYVITGFIHEVFSRLAPALAPNSSTRAWRITGDYGTGKSAFALSFARLAACERDDLPAALHPFLPKGLRLEPVLISGAPQPLEQSIKQGLAEMRRRAFTSPHKALEQSYPGQHGLLESISHHIAALKKQKIADGIVLILDELGQNLHHAALHPSDGDISLLQALGERADRSGGNALVVLALLHQGLSTYSGDLDHAAKREWEKVAGRFKEVVFAQPLEQVAALVAEMLGLRPGAVPRQLVAAAEENMKIAAAEGLYGAAPSETFLQEVAPRLYPLHPTVFPFLVLLLRRFGQNERSLVGFLSSHEPHGFREFAEKHRFDAGFYRLSHLYDFFKTNLAASLSNGQSAHWAVIDATVNHARDLGEPTVSLLKTIGLVNLINDPAVVATEALVHAAVESNGIDAALKKLRGTSAIIHERGAAKGFTLWPHSSVIFECIQRFARGLSPVESAYVVLEGRQQKKPNQFLEQNQRACEYFERTYGALEARTKKIRFQDTLVVRYSKDVLPLIEDKARFKGNSKSAKAVTLNFLVSVFEDGRGKTDRKIGTLSLTWKFPIGSVLAQEAMDLDALCRYRAKRKTALVECLAEYEVVGRKGVPVSLSLENAEGFAEAARSGGRGAFIPAQDRIKSLTAQWKEVMETANARQWLPAGQLANLQAEFGRFDGIYGETLTDLHVSGFAVEKVSAVAASYRALLLAVNQVGHQDARRQLLRILLRVGLAQVQRSGRRPPMAVVCPWHPLRMEATLGRQIQVLRLLEQLLGRNRPPFSDGAKGDLFFREVEQLLNHPLYPEMATVWENTECLARVATQAFGAYTLHQPAEKADASVLPALDDESTTAAATIEYEMNEYLRLQPHQRDNLSILLYECDSPDLPTAVVDAINRINEARGDDKITCQVLLMHRNEDHLRKIYRDLVAKGVDTEADPTEASGDFLARVRVNITAANRLRREGRSQPVDLAYCRDLISGQAKPVWEWLTRETEAPETLQPHQWSRRLPVHEGERKVKLQLAAPPPARTKSPLTGTTSTNR